MRDVVVLGAGLTGMATAFHLGKRDLDLVVIDKSDRVGGVIKSVAEDGFLYEEGPNSGVIGNAEVIHLFEELQGECEMEIADHFVKRRYVLKNGDWQALPGGVKAAVTTPLFSLKDKFRILLEPFRPAGKDPHETLARLVRRRMGESFLNYAIDPFIIGVYAGDPGRLVPKYALPKLYNLEQQYGSFIGGSIKKQFKTKTEEEKKVTRGVFSVIGGISSLIEAMERKIGKERFVLNISQLSVMPVGDHFVVSFLDRLGEKITIETKKVISTIGAHQLNQVLPFVEPQLLAKVSALHYTRVLEIVLGFKSWQGMKLDAFGGLIPFVENRELLGILFMSSLFRDRAPAGGALFSIFMGGVRRQDLVDLSEEEVKQIVQKEFTNLMKLNSFQPDLFKIIWHPYAIPQYEADSGERFKAIEKIEKIYPGLVVGGNLRDGIGMADRILQAKRLADSV